jgi:hypothetical protein
MRGRQEPRPKAARVELVMRRLLASLLVLMVFNALQQGAAFPLPLCTCTRWTCGRVLTRLQACTVRHGRRMHIPCHQVVQGRRGGVGITITRRSGVGINSWKGERGEQPNSCNRVRIRLGQCATQAHRRYAQPGLLGVSALLSAALLCSAEWRVVFVCSETDVRVSRLERW